MARQGDQKAWHFAHATRGAHEVVSGSCEFSLYVSVRQMVLQLYDGPIATHLPKVEASVAKHLTALSRPRSITHPIAPEREAMLGPGDVGGAIGGVQADVVFNDGGIRIGIFVSHPGRRVGRPPSLEAEVRLLEVPLDGIERLLWSPRLRGDTYTARLTHFLGTASDGRRWLSYPGLCAAEAEVQARAGTNAPAANAHAATPSSYECIMCKVQFAAVECRISCPRCGEGIYTRRLA